MHLALLPSLLADIFGFNAGAMAGMMIPIVAIICGGAIAITAMYFHHRRRELWHETARIALERGQPLPPPDTYDEAEKAEITKDRTADHDVRGGMVLIAVGAGLWLMFSGFAPSLRYIGAIPGLIGVALLLYALFTRKDRQPHRTRLPAPDPFVTDAELIVRAAAQEDRAAFGQLVQRHQSAVRQFLRHLTRGDHALADDLAQETFVQAWRSLARYHGGSTFSTWLLGIAHNHWRNARRRRPHTSLDDETATEPSVPATTSQSDLHSDLSAALAHLDPDERLALHLNYQQGLSHAEIAALLDWPLGTVKTHLARGKDRLRPLLAVWNPQT